MPEGEEEQLELRLLSDPEFGEEFDTIVNEMTDQYLNDELSGDERERFQKYFLSSKERQNKLEFAAELLRRAESERGQAVPEKDSRPSFFEQVVAFWRRPYFAHVALTVAVIVIAVIIYPLVTSDKSPQYLPLDLTISSSNRAAGAASATVKLPPRTGLKINLVIPETARGAKNYDASLLGESVNSSLTIDQRTEQMLTVTVPAGLLTRGSYAIQLSQVKPDDTKERVPGSYLFTVE